MSPNDPRLELLRRDLRIALALELFAELCVVMALLATLGAFNNGRPTTTPVLAQVYLVADVVVTIVVILRTRQMLAAAERGDIARVRSLNLRAWAWIAFAFSAMLPTIYLNAAADAIPPAD